ncbi:Peroxiredoxin-2E [Forsythia ovata]|uniref:glutaredoxin-dependent peroxiredoxin n=1 Tax=Forsythia ovata TaxID=205694 RepID=A0ABD1V0I7_9LAMI
MPHSPILTLPTSLKRSLFLSLLPTKKLFSLRFLGRLLPLVPRKHLLGFVEKAGELKAKGVDTIACISVNDAFVMKAWKKDMNVCDEVLLNDGNEDFTKAIGCELDLSDKLIGLGVKSIMYAIYVVDGVVKRWW